jgi:hypothetical protein
MRDRVIGGVGVLWGGFLLPRGVLLTVLLLAAVGGARAASESVAMPHEIDAWRARFVSAQHTYDGRRPYFVEDTAKLVVGRIDQRPVAALLFTLEGQHAHEDWQQYVAVFWSSAGNYLFCCVRRVGAKGTRLLDDIGIDDDRIRLSGKAYAAADAPCCPSRAIVVRFALARHRLTELGGATPGNRP